MLLSTRRYQKKEEWISPLPPDIDGWIQQQRYWFILNVQSEWRSLYLSRSEALIVK